MASLALLVVELWQLLVVELWQQLLVVELWQLLVVELWELLLQGALSMEEQLQEELPRCLQVSSRPSKQTKKALGALAHLV